MRTKGNLVRNRSHIEHVMPPTLPHTAHAHNESYFETIATQNTWCRTLRMRTRLVIYKRKPHRTRGAAHIAAHCACAQGKLFINGSHTEHVVPPTLSHTAHAHKVSYLETIATQNTWCRPHCRTLRMRTGIVIQKWEPH
jgi:hypothetical protein